MNVVAYKTMDGKWKCLKKLPANKYILTFKTGGDAVEFIKDYNELIERLFNEYPGLKIVQLKYIREVVREQDIVCEYKPTSVEVSFLKEWIEKNKQKRTEAEKLRNDEIARMRINSMMTQ